MNERIKTLFIQAGGGVEEENGNLWTYSDDLDPEKFAQLIVRDLIDSMIKRYGDDDELPIQEIEFFVKQHFGVKE
jgi:hypothetical protein